MGKSHIGLVYSQQINELLDQLANLVSISGLFLRLLSMALVSLLSTAWWPNAEASCWPFLGVHIFQVPSFENRITLREVLAFLFCDRILCTKWLVQPFNMAEGPSGENYFHKHTKTLFAFFTGWHLHRWWVKPLVP